MRPDLRVERAALAHPIQGTNTETPVRTTMHGPMTGQGLRAAANQHVENEEMGLLHEITAKANMLQSLKQQCDVLQGSINALREDVEFSLFVANFCLQLSRILLGLIQHEMYGGVHIWVYYPSILSNVYICYEHHA